MDYARIVQALAEYPQLPYEAAKKQALEAGIPESVFEKAWNEAKPTAVSDAGLSSTDTRIFWLFVAITVVGVLANVIYLGSTSSAHAWWIEPIDFASTFTDSALALYAATKLLAISSSFSKAIGMSVFFYVVFFLERELGLSAVFLGIGTLLSIGSAVFIMRVYDIGFLRTFFLIIIQALLVLAINIVVLGAYRVFAY